jgi:hypothetical protein
MISTSDPTEVIDQISLSSESSPAPKKKKKKIQKNAVF